jgi:MFS family permease
MGFWKRFLVLIDHSLARIFDLTYQIGLILAIPYGILANKRGKKLTVTLSMFGYALGESWVLTVLLFPNVFPVHAVWFSPLFRILGGGVPVMIASYLAIIAEGSPANMR